MVLLAPVNLMSARHSMGAVTLASETVDKLAVSAPVVDNAGCPLAPVKHRCWKLLATPLVVEAVLAVTMTFRP